MENLKVVEVGSDFLIFDNGIKLKSEHDQDCCENHYLCFNDLSIEDFEGLEFDLSNDDFFERIKDYGIALNPLNGYPIRVPGYGYNNGYYSSNLSLLLIDKEGNELKYFEISDCQIIFD